ncbi:MAG: SNF2 helicase associated domain-containing protein [Sarcina sp.]
MNIEEFKIILAKNMNSSSYKKGKRCFSNKLVSNVSENIDEKFNALDIYGKVFSESDLSVYSTNISIDLNNNSLVYTSCECIDFQKKSEDDNLYFCKHLAATGLAYLEKMNKSIYENKFSIWREGTLTTTRVFTNKDEGSRIETVDVAKEILEQLKAEDKKDNLIKIDVYLDIPNIGSSYSKFYEVSFKVGIDKMYVLKDIEEFIKALEKGRTIEFGKNFTFDGKLHKVTEEDEDLIEFLKEQKEINEMLNVSYRNYGNEVLKGKYLRLVPASIERFIKLIVHKKVSINLKGETDFYYVKEGNIPLELEVLESNDRVKIQNKMEEFPERIDKGGKVYIYKNIVYLIGREQQAVYGKLYKELRKEEFIEFPKSAIGEVFNYIVPKLEAGAKEIKINNNLLDAIVREELSLEFYLDRNKSSIWIKIKAIYGEKAFDYIEGYKGNEIIIRDILNEEKAKDTLGEYKFFIGEGKFIFNGSEEDLYYFLKEGIEDIENLGNVYYSESFNNQKIYKSSNINAEINDNGGGYLDFSFEIGAMKDEEIKNIVKAVKVHKKFYKLKNGDFLSLEEEAVKKFFRLLDDLSVDNKFNRAMKIHKSRALYLTNEIEKDSFIVGRNLLAELAKKINSSEEIDYEIPKALNGELRDYQKEGFKWFKTLSHYGFGGILADEMGLGKTIQSIAFLLSEKGKKTIIITPTALIYNWKAEFEKFGPSLKVLLLHGNKCERALAMEEYENYDVILTTYGTLKNDFDFYEKKSFDYSIIDEGQNIKNCNSLSSEVVKAINAKVKFALTGTPIENNLMELWSIFEYIMPGYLYSKSKFQDKFLGKNSEIDKLKLMIKPFILRRLKKDVMVELPEKIEKKFIVEMSEEQKKVYKAFAEDIKNKIKNSNGDTDKLTILSYLTKLRQICLDPSLVIEGYEGENGKLEVAMEIIRDRIYENKKILLFSQFTSVLDRIKKELDKEEIEYYYLDGSTKANLRVEMVDDFNKDEEKNIFLISLKAGGTGLNLTSASTVLHFDPWWNPAIEDQATDRAHRMGQKNVVEVIKLISKGTIEEKIIKLQESKKEIIGNIMEGNYQSGTVLSSLKEEEIINLFEFR